MFLSLGEGVSGLPYDTHFLVGASWFAKGLVAARYRQGAIYRYELLPEGGLRRIGKGEGFVNFW